MTFRTSWLKSRPSYATAEGRKRRPAAVSGLRPSSLHDVGHHGVEERLFGHALKVREDGEERELGCVVGFEGALEAVEERRLPDAALTRDHQAVVVEDVQDAGQQLLPSEEEALVQHGGARDVRVEAAADGSAPPHDLDTVAKRHQRKRGAERGGDERAGLPEAQDAHDAERLRALGPRRVHGDHDDLVGTGVQGDLLLEAQASRSLDVVP